MCVGKCSRCVGLSLFVLSVLSLLLNLSLLFPNCDGSYLQKGLIGTYVMDSFHVGFWLGGVLVLLTGIQTLLSGYKMLFSLVLCTLATIGALTSLLYVITALNNGPYCLYRPSEEAEEEWGYPLANKTIPCSAALPTNTSYADLYIFGIPFVHPVCIEPPNIVPWTASFLTCLFFINFMETVLCTSQLINAGFGICCGLCDPKKLSSSRMSVSTPSVYQSYLP
ncbi:transmembrane 4 L6 family member 5-like [Pelobates fuscus]|uniref:transmembrane 4 L6 family member 5-like n=1 Tax=Pelobates fuscus TaxID=191477 RepID=UPI002FE49BF4